MSKKLKLGKLETFDITEYLDGEETITEYLNTVIEENDPALLVAALGDIARARGMTQLARDSGVTRESLYRALSVNSSPRFDTIAKVLKGLGLKFQVVYS